MGLINQMLNSIEAGTIRSGQAMARPRTHGFLYYISLVTVVICLFGSLPVNALESPEEARALALDADAPEYAKKLWKRADKIWLKLLKARAAGKTAAAEELANEAMELFSAAELKSIQAAHLQPANEAIENALQNKASRYAPVTLEQARALTAQAEELLAADRLKTDAADMLVEQAAAKARHAAQIAELAASKPTTEEIVLRWEGYLLQLQTAADISSPIDTESAAVANNLAAEISRALTSEAQLRLDLANSQAFNAALEEEIRDLDEQLGGASSERQKLVLELEQQARTREQFAQAEALFGPTEAIVFRQSDDIVVRVIGLQFASGSPDLDTGNETLLNKIESVIGIYPRSLIVIEGHTDSRGSDRINKRLSEQRAQVVADFVVNELKIPAHRITAVGYGAERPIANNETAAGREQNRRIDLLISPASQASY
jgi:OOP family OmpA-OmpF porin